MIQSIVQVMRSSAGIVEVLCTYPNTKDGYTKAEECFIKALASSIGDADELEEALENGHGDELDGDTINIIQSDFNIDM